jgi:hypothetical protein
MRATVQRYSGVESSSGHRDSVEEAKGEDHILLRDVTAGDGPVYATVFARRDCPEHCGVELSLQGEIFTAEPQGRDSMQHPSQSGRY